VLKPFDLQGLQHHLNQVFLKVDKLLDKFIGDHRNEKRLDNSKDFFAILLSLSINFYFIVKHLMTTS
jgi:hypothetical protein